ncbi:carbonic anhydrase family protein [uncultured Rhodoblastus sp.]|uniref:carbonic anhydrase n=1 Tax=uncultured Rhodoblastus sp. TaxID=543037 RepID=UPI0025DC7CC7|nr:carbonic anhydrase family protein [uncultured Rhodoblastus sp.]
MRLSRRGFIAGFIACRVCAGLARAEEAAHWSYEGKDGIADWGRIDPTYKACSIGAQQSPIDLKQPMPAQVGGLHIDWKPEAYKILNNGHTIEAVVNNPDSVKLGGEVYQLKQFHFHHPSEHAVKGERHAMEIHFVHAHPNGDLAVIGVFIKPGARNAEFAEIMALAPATAGEKKFGTPIDPNRLLPKKRIRFRYEGSLTTPPCSEVVDWNVFEQPIEVAEADIARFKAIFPMNARPIQTTGRRFLLKGI